MQAETEVSLHECEPNLTELLKIQRELFAAESTDENMKKIEALKAQIARHIAAGEKPKPEQKEQVAFAKQM